MENRITAFINKRISLYNNVRIPKPMIPTIKKDVVYHLYKFLVAEFAEFGDSFYVENTAIIIDKDDDKIVQRVEEFYNMFKKVLRTNQQTELEIQKYGSHKEISDAVSSVIVSLYESSKY